VAGTGVPPTTSPIGTLYAYQISGVLVFGITIEKWF
jgi:hypothetical protein